MASKGSILQQGDGLGTLKELLESVQNPKLITKAHEEYRKQIALTEEEQSKVEEARSYLNDYEYKVQQLNKAQDDLNNDKAIHANNVDQFNQSYELRTKELKEIGSSLDERSLKLASIADLHEKSKAEFYAVKATQDDQIATALKSIQEREDAVAKKEELINSETERLTNLESELKIKSAKIKASLSEF